MAPNGTLAAVANQAVELLARGPEDFADDVPIISWEQWLKESAPEEKV